LHRFALADRFFGAAQRALTDRWKIFFPRRRDAGDRSIASLRDAIAARAMVRASLRENSRTA
jgi:hypothetical protein